MVCYVRIKVVLIVKNLFILNVGMCDMYTVIKNKFRVNMLKYNRGGPLWL